MKRASPLVSTTPLFMIDRVAVANVPQADGAPTYCSGCAQNHRRHPFAGQDFPSALGLRLCRSQARTDYTRMWVANPTCLRFVSNRRKEAAESVSRRWFLRSCRARTITRLQLASRPKCRMRWKPSGSMCKRHGLVAAATLGAIVLAAEGHAAFVEREEPAVGDRYPVRVARESLRVREVGASNYVALRSSRTWLPRHDDVEHWTVGFIASAGSRRPIRISVKPFWNRAVWSSLSEQSPTPPKFWEGPRAWQLGTRPAGTDRCAIEPTFYLSVNPATHRGRAAASRAP
jgi:hypothetical protein